MVGNGVEIFCADEAVEALDEGVVQDEHDGREVPGPFRVPEQHLADVADVFELWMAKSEFPSLISKLNGLMG